MNIFIGQVKGPESVNSFATGFYEIVQPYLLDRNITAAAFVDPDERYFMQGYLPDDTAYYDLVYGIEQLTNWKTLFTRLSSIAGLPSAKARSLYCEMPHNKPHPISGSYKTCSQNHLIANNHEVANCPICGNGLS